MAEIALQTEKNDSAPRVLIHKWETLTNADTCEEVIAAHLADKTVQAIGTFDSATLNIQGSNDGTNWFNLKDAQGNDIALTAAGGAIILENPLYIRPAASGGSGGQDIDILICAKD